MPIVMAIPVYFLLLTFPENSKALNERGEFWTESVLFVGKC
jgi:hypothetical protein